MQNAVDVDRLNRALADHPWLVQALRDADWWVHDDGSVSCRAQFGEIEPQHPGVIALAEALGCELVELPAGTELPLADPDEPPLRFEDLPRLGGAAAN